MAVKVIVPNKQYNTIFHGVEFKQGEGIFEDEALAKSLAESLGYEIEQIKKAAPKKSPAKKSTTRKAPAKKTEEKE